MFRRMLIGLVTGLVLAASAEARLIVYSPQSFNFGSTAVGDTSAPQNLLFRYSGPDSGTVLMDVSFRHREDEQGNFLLLFPHMYPAYAALDSIYRAILMYRQDYGEDPWSLWQLDSLAYIDLPADMMSQWSWSLIGSPIAQIEGVSTGEMPEGAGHVILFDVGTNRFSGYGINYGERHIPYRGVYTIPVSFMPQQEGACSDTISVVINTMRRQRAEVYTIVVTGNGTADVRREETPIPEALRLEAYPNPFNSTARIAFEVGVAGWTQMDIMDANGRLVERLVDGAMPAGRREVVWNASGRPAGVYLARLSSATGVRSEPLILMK